MLHLKKVFRCLYLSSNKIYISRHVQFDETKFSFKNHSLLAIFTSPPAHFILGPAPTFLSTSTSGLSLAQTTTSSPNSQPTAAVSNPNNSLLPDSPIHSQPAEPLKQSTPDNPPMHTTSVSPTPDNPTRSISDSSPLPPLRSSTTTHPIIPPTTTHPMTTQNRENTRPIRTFPNHIALTTILESEPTTFNQANTKLEWHEAMSQEMNALAINKAWTLVLPPPNHKPIDYK